MNEINRNFASSKEYSEDSFIGIFHESQIWDDEEYYKLESYLYNENDQYQDKNRLPRDVFWPTMRIYSYLMHSIGCHFDANDGFEIKGLSQEQLYQRRERLQLIFEAFFKGKMPNKNTLDY